MKDVGDDTAATAVGVGTVELLLTWLEWVEVEIAGFSELMEDLQRRRGALMVAVVAREGL